METGRPFDLESFLGTVPGMIYRSRLVPEPHVIEFVSDEMTSIAGYPASDFTGDEPKRRWAELIHPDDVAVNLEKIVATPLGGTIVEVEYRLRRSDGSYAWIHSRFRKVAGEDGSLWVPGAAFDVTALYFTIAEALANVAKYADATHASVVVQGQDGLVTAEITDDGRGGATSSGRSGLRGLADRLDAIGGSFEAESPFGRGTVIRERVPLEGRRPEPD